MRFVDVTIINSNLYRCIANYIGFNLMYFRCLYDVFVRLYDLDYKSVFNKSHVSVGHTDGKGLTCWGVTLEVGY